jgi:hypothetical protein
MGCDGLVLDLHRLAQAENDRWLTSTLRVKGGGGRLHTKGEGGRGEGGGFTLRVTTGEGYGATPFTPLHHPLHVCSHGQSVKGGGFSGEGGCPPSVPGGWQENGCFWPICIACLDTSEYQLAGSSSTASKGLQVCLAKAACKQQVSLMICSIPAGTPAPAQACLSCRASSVCQC